MALFSQEDPIANSSMFTLPGIAETVKPNGSYQALSYYLPYEDEILEIVNTYFNPYSKELVDLNVVNTDALLAQAGIQRAEREQQKEDTENAEGIEGDTVELDENGNPIKKDSDSSVDDENNRDESASANESTGDDNDEPGAGDIDQNQSDILAPDEVLKDEAEEIFGDAETQNPVHESGDDGSEGANITDNPPIEQPLIEEAPVQAGGIPGEVLKTDLE